MTNQFGLDTHYFKEKLGILLRDIDSHTPEEMARALTRLGLTADGAAAAGCIPKLPMGWSLEKFEWDVTTIHIYRTTDGAWCGGGIEGDDGAAGLRYEFLNDLMGDE